MKIYLFFMYLNVCSKFNLNKSFIKTNMKQFRGINNYFVTVPHLQDVNTINLQKSKSSLKKEDTQLKSYVASINSYYNFYKNELSSNTNLLINYILINN